jgi:hypothetical protein
MDNTILLGGWIAAGLTLFMYSSLYKDNFFYRLGEHMYLGLSVGYIFTRVLYANLINDFYKPVFEGGNYILIIPAILGLSLYTQFFPKIAWVGRITFAAMMGYGAGLGIPRVISGGLFKQLEGIIVPLVNETGTFTFNNLNSVIIIAGVCSVLIYFLFSVEHKGVIKGISRVGIYFVMISFGASFGYTVMGRMSLLIGRCYDLIELSTAKYYYATIILMFLIILTLLITELRAKKAKTIQT